MIQSLEPRYHFSGTITGRVFQDLNGTYTRDAGEPGAAGQQIYVDANQNGALDAGEPVAVSDAGGAYALTGLAPGRHVVRQVMPAGIRRTIPVGGGYTCDVTSSQTNLANRDFGNTLRSLISGLVFDDANGNGKRDAGEAGIPKVRIHLDGNANDRYDHPENYVISNADGMYYLSAPSSGTVRVRHDTQAARRSTLPAGRVREVELSSGGELYGRNFGADLAPNVVVFLVDDMGWIDNSTYGSTFYKTPHLDAMAERGMLFTQAYAPSPVCSPSRAAILTGQSPARSHITNWIGAPKAPDAPGEAAWTDELPQSELTLPEVLKAGGYRTGHIGKWHLGNQYTAGSYPSLHGFDVNVGGSHMGNPGSYFANAAGSFNLPGLGNGSSNPGAYLTDRLTDSAVQFIRNSPRSQPFFLHLAHYGIHTPIQAPANRVAQFSNAPVDAVHGHDNATYAAMIQAIDDSLGRIQQELVTLGIDDDTMVIFTSDNGGLANDSYEPAPTSNAPLRDGKGTRYEGGLRVPLVVQWPGFTAPGATTDTPVILTDLYPTVLGATGVADAPGHGAKLDGADLKPLLTGGAAPGARSLYWHYPHEHDLVPYGVVSAKPFAAIRSGSHKLILDYATNAVELFDLSTDPDESDDLAAAQPGIATSLRTELLDWLAAVGANVA